MTWTRPVRSCFAVSLLLVAMSLGTRLLAYRLQVADPGSSPIAAARWFDVNTERNVPTAWSVLLLATCAAVAGALACRADRLRAGWVLVSVVAAVLSLDEALYVHERLGDAGRAVAGEALHFTWVVPGAAAAAVVGLLALAALRRQPVRVVRRLCLAGVVYLSGALLVETLSGLALRAFGDRELYVALTAIEEGLEMAGACLLLAVLWAELVPVRYAQPYEEQPVRREPREHQRRCTVAAEPADAEGPPQR